MNIYTLYISKCDKLRKLFNPILCLLSGLKRFAEYIENICGSRCGDETFHIIFYGLAERLVGVCEKRFSSLDNIHNDIGINQYSHCLANRSSRIVSSSIV